MSSFQAVRLVAARELKERGRSKSYIISTIFTILILAGVIIVPSLIGDDFATHEVGLVGEGGDAIVAAASDLAAQRAEDGDDPDVFETTVFATVDEAEAAIEAGDISTAIVDGTELVTAGSGGFFGDSSGQGLLQEAASTLRIQDLVAENEDAGRVLELLASTPLEVRSLDGADEEDQALRGAIAFGGMVLMYMAVLTYGNWMLSGVTEEKTNRVVEVLLAALKPWQLFAGKLVGIGLLGIGQMVIVVGLALVALIVTGRFDLPTLPVDSVVALIGWFILGFLLYATLFGAAGSLVSRMEDAQGAATPLSILAIAGYFFAFAALGDPSGTMAVVGTYVPFTAPYVAPIRLALGEITALEMTVAVLITAVTIALMVRLAGRIYAGGLLRFGGKTKWREAFRAGG